MLRIYNSLTRKKELFTPLEEGRVRMYVCGMTVYDYCHIGHARTVTAFDVVARFLRAKGYRLTYVRNITDIDDKIISRANESGERTEELTERMIAAMHEDFRRLGNIDPDQQPKATEYVQGMVEMIDGLISKGAAYAADNGDVYFRVRHFSDYGRLSGKVLDDLEAGARVAVEEGKEDPLDFVLWKSSKPDEPCWSSPWGDGRPGWHIECSVMGKCCLGETFDIHGGGADLKFPHHENEIAQSETYNGKQFVNTWMHSGAIRVDNVKMSKSLGNFFTIREVLDHFPDEAVRYFLISSHYRSPINYSDSGLKEALVRLQRMYTALAGVNWDGVAPASGTVHETKFHAAMDDDFNTPEALAVLFELVRELNTARREAEDHAPSLAALLVKLAAILGLLQGDPQAFLRSGEVDSSWIESKITERSEAKKSGDYAKADRIRDELAAAGVVLQDGRGGTDWRMER